MNSYNIMVRRYLTPRLAALPTDRDGYLRGLLELHADLVGRGHPSPEQALATAMRVPEENVQAELRAARLGWADGDGQGVPSHL